MLRWGARSSGILKDLMISAKRCRAEMRRGIAKESTCIAAQSSGSLSSASVVEKTYTEERVIQKVEVGLSTGSKKEKPCKERDC